MPQKSPPSRDELESSDAGSDLLEDGDEKLKTRILEVCKVFDQNGDGTIDAGDIGCVFRCLLVNVPQEQVLEIESQLHKSVDNTVAVDHLIPRLLSYLQVGDRHCVPSAQDLEAAFSTLVDAQNGASLTRERLQQLMTARGEPLVDSEMAEMTGHLAIRKNGVVDWRSYCKDIQLTLKEHQDKVN